jgi:hypothetical protein
LAESYRFVEQLELFILDGKQYHRKHASCASFIPVYLRLCRIALSVTRANLSGIATGRRSIVPIGNLWRPMSITV